MIDPAEPEFSLLCSACYTPCSGTEAHVIPRWNPVVERVLTTYRCGKCLPAALTELRTLLDGAGADLLSGFFDFLARQGYTKDLDQLRAAPVEEQRRILVAVVDAIADGRVVFEP